MKRKVSFGRGGVGNLKLERLAVVAQTTCLAHARTLNRVPDSASRLTKAVVEV